MRAWDIFIYIPKVINPEDLETYSQGDW
jgi:hypothetical protein